MLRTVGAEGQRREEKGLRAVEEGGESVFEFHLFAMFETKLQL